MNCYRCKKTFWVTNEQMIFEGQIFLVKNKHDLPLSTIRNQGDVQDCYEEYHFTVRKEPEITEEE